MNGYYGPTNLGHIGEGYRDTNINNLKVLLVRYRDDSEPFLWSGGGIGKRSGKHMRE